MKKIALAIVGLALLGAPAFAQTNQVLSRNAVGYVKVDMVRSNFHYVSHSFLDINGAPVTVTNLIGGQVPDGSVVFVWDNIAQAYRSENKTVIGWLPGTNRLTPGRGFWLKIATTAASNSYPVFLMGEVPDKTTMPTSTIAIAAGFTMIGNPYPVKTSFTNLEVAKTALNGDVAFFWNPGTQNYRSENRTVIGWLPGTNVVNPGEGFWYKRNSGTATNWVQSKPYTWP